MSQDKGRCTEFSRRKHYDIDQFWKPGMPVTEEDRKLLKEVTDVYHSQGYVPAREEVSNVAQLKARFRTWNNVLCAAGLPSRNDPEQVRRRQVSARRKTGDQKL